MKKKAILCSALFLSLAGSVVAPAGATTLIRQSLEELVAGNREVVVGEVLEARSYWNEDHTFILTDHRIATQEALKGGRSDQEITVTLMGGRVGSRSTLIVGGAELVPGHSYLLFLHEDDLPGAKSALTVRYHSQGVFDIQIGRGGLRAVSQASGHPLHPDRQGAKDAPGGDEGLPFATLMQTIRQTVARQEVQR